MVSCARFPSFPPSVFVSESSVDRRGPNRSTFPPPDRVSCGSTDRNAPSKNPSCAFLRARGDGACDARLLERRVTSANGPLRKQKPVQKRPDEPVFGSDQWFQSSDQNSGFEPAFSSGLPSAGSVDLGSVFDPRIYRATFPVYSVFRFLSNSVRKGSEREANRKGQSHRRRRKTTSRPTVRHGERARVLCEAWLGTTRHARRGESRLLGAGEKAASRRGARASEARSRTSVQGNRRSLRIARAKTKADAPPKEVRERWRGVPSQESGARCGRSQERRDLAGGARWNTGHTLCVGWAQNTQRTITTRTKHVEEKRTALSTREPVPFE